MQLILFKWPIAANMLTMLDKLQAIVLLIQDLVLIGMIRSLEEHGIKVMDYHCQVVQIR